MFNPYFRFQEPSDLTRPPPTPLYDFLRNFGPTRSQSKKYEIEQSNKIRPQLSEQMLSESKEMAIDGY